MTQHRRRTPPRGRRWRKENGLEETPGKRKECPQRTIKINESQDEKDGNNAKKKKGKGEKEKSEWNRVTE
ncbi:hypothetical protein [Nonomuraea dietziae]|uniref:hypothetical protein n=1 Tax=Nonomuraea dietziae TaxID=65515 RepID=UPI0031CE82A1